MFYPRISSDRVARLAIIIALITIAGAAESFAQSHDAADRPDHVMILPSDHDWSPAPPSLPPGARVMIVEGNPAEAGEFTMRLWLPSDYVIAPHFHPGDEHVTVISGALYMGLGTDVDDASAKKLTPGGFAMMRAGTVHFALTRQETVLQLHGVGPWGLTYVDSDDNQPGETR